MTHASGRGLRARWAAVLAGAALLALPSLTSAQSVTLDQAVRQALQHQPAMVQAQGAVRNAAAGERAAIGAYLPTLSANLGSSLASTERFNASTIPASSGRAIATTPAPPPRSSCTTALAAPSAGRRRRRPPPPRPV